MPIIHCFACEVLVFDKQMAFHLRRGTDASIDGLSSLFYKPCCGVGNQLLVNKFKVRVVDCGVFLHSKTGIDFRPPLLMCW